MVVYNLNLQDLLHSFYSITHFISFIIKNIIFRPTENLLPNMRLNIIQGAYNIPQKMICRNISCSSVAQTKLWRVSKGLSANKNAEGILTDGPDYTFLDGRPTPLLHKQKQRLLKQQGYASKIVELISELDFAKDRHQKILQEKDEERQRIISNRLKPKGSELNEKK